MKKATMKTPTNIVAGNRVKFVERYKAASSNPRDRPK